MVTITREHCKQLYHNLLLKLTRIYHTCCICKATNILDDTTHPSHNLLTSDINYRGIWDLTARLQINTFYYLCNLCTSMSLFTSKCLAQHTTLLSLNLTSTVYQLALDYLYVSLSWCFFIALACDMYTSLVLCSFVTSCSHVLYNVANMHVLSSV